jgi:hypothetical protein
MNPSPGERPPQAHPWEQTRALLCQSEPAFYELEPGGALGLSLDHEGWMLEVTPDGRMICQTGIDMEDVQSLLSDGTPEDLGTDELAKQAKYYLQPTVAKFRKTLAAAGFEERTDMNDEYVAVAFERTVDFGDLENVKRTVRWCREHIR